MSDEEKKEEVTREKMEVMTATIFNYVFEELDVKDAAGFGKMQSVLALAFGKVLGFSMSFQKNDEIRNKFLDSVIPNLNILIRGEAFKTCTYLDKKIDKKGDINGKE